MFPNRWQRFEALHLVTASRSVAETERSLSSPTDASSSEEKEFVAFSFVLTAPTDSPRSVDTGREPITAERD